MVIDNALNQQLTLGMMLNFQEAAIQGASKLNEECFSTLEFKILFKTIRDLVNLNKSVDLYSVNDFLKTKGKLISLEELSSIREDFYVPEAFESLVDSLLDVQQRKSLIKNLSSIIHSLESKSIPPTDALKEIGFLSTIKNSKEIINSSNYIEVRKEHDYRKKHIKEMRSGFEELDEKLTYNFPGGEISIIAARPNNGKSTFKANFIAKYCSMKTGIGIASYALEQTLNVESDRLESIVSGIDLVDIAQNKFWPDEDPRWEKLDTSREEISSWNYHLIEGTGKSALEILSEVRNLYYKYNVRLFFFDLFDRIKDIAESTGDKPAKIGQVMNMFLVIAKELDIHFNLLVQINRDSVKNSKKGERTTKKRPELHELKGSGSYEEFARTVLLLHNPRAYDPDLLQSILEVEIAKQNNGPTLRLEFPFDTSNLRIGHTTKTRTTSLIGLQNKGVEDA